MNVLTGALYLLLTFGYMIGAPMLAYLFGLTP